jgi:hypothetical protein
VFGINSYCVSFAVKDLYITWNNIPSKTHFAQYFSMTFNGTMWLNGKYYAKNEAVWLKDIMDAIVKFGTENPGCPLLMNNTIRHIRSSISVV